MDFRDSFRYYNKIKIKILETQYDLIHDHMIMVVFS